VQGQQHALIFCTDGRRVGQPVAAGNVFVAAAFVAAHNTFGVSAVKSRRFVEANMSGLASPLNMCNVGLRLAWCGLWLGLGAFCPAVAVGQSKPAATEPAATQPAGAVQDAMKYLYSLPRPGADTRSVTANDPAAVGPNQRRRPGNGRMIPSPDAQAAGDPARPKWVAVVPSEELDQDFGGARPTTRPAQAPMTGLDQPGVAEQPSPAPRQGDASRGQRRQFPRDPRGRFVPDHRFGQNFVGPPVPPGMVVGPGADGNVYRFGFTNEYDFGRFYTESNARTEMVLQHYANHLTGALKLFRQRRYAEAADGFRLAAETNQGDPSSRLYAAHALFAMGRYQEAIPYLRRAFELQPKIVFLNFDIRDDYGERRDFQQQVAALEEALRQSPANVDRMIMLGYIRYYSGQRPAAFEVLNQARRMAPQDPLIGQLLANSRPPDVMLDRR
jgi:hypothetical protein